MKLRGFFQASLLVAVAASFTWVASCSSDNTPDNEGATDASTDAVDAPADLRDASIAEAATDGSDSATRYISIRLNSDGLCYPDSIPIDDAGEIDCHMLVFFSPPGQCDGPGYTPASAVDVAGIEGVAAKEGFQLTDGGVLCSLAQIPGGACQVSSSVGWCFINGSCVPDAGCAHDICTSEGYDAGSDFFDAWLSCP